MESTSVHRPSRRAVLAAALAMAGTGLHVPSALAQGGKVTRLYVGFPPGGSTDVVARLIATHLNKPSAPAIVENVPGAAGRLGVMRVKGSPADGQHVLVAPEALMVLYPHVYRKLAYEPFKDFAPVASVGSIAFSLVVSTAIVPPSVKTLQDLAAWVRANPKHANYATGGAGTPMHFVGVMVARHLGLPLTHVAYRGATPMVQDLLGGQIAMGVTVLGDSLPHLDSGKIRVIAVRSPQRSRYLPGAPTFGELGAPEIQAQESFSVFVPAGTPSGVIERLADAVREAVGQAEFQEALAKLASEPMVLGPAESARQLQQALERWRPVVQASGFSIDD